MHARQTVNTLNQIFTTSDRLGATIPKAIRTEHDRLAALAERVRHFDPPSRVGAAVLDALAADRDPYTDEGVRAAAVAVVVGQGSNGIENALSERVGDFLHRNADAIFGAFVKPFDTAAATIAAAVGKLGKVDLDDSRAVLTRGPEAAGLWADIQNAEQVIKTIRDTRSLLAAAHRAYECDPRFRILVYADVPPARFLDDGLARVELPAWQIAQRGYRLSLATPSVIKQRIAAVNAETANRQHRRDDAQRLAYARTHGTGVVPQDAA